MWCHLFMLPITLLVLIYFLGNLSGVAGWVLGFAAVVLWWLGVLRDHAKDDVPYLQKHLLLLQGVVRELSAAGESLRSHYNVPDSHEVWGYLASRQDYAELLARMKEREKRLCQRLRLVQVSAPQ
jgi:hypothetical protein